MEYLLNMYKDKGNRVEYHTTLFTLPPFPLYFGPIVIIINLKFNGNVALHVPVLSKRDMHSSCNILLDWLSHNLIKSIHH